MKSTAMAKDNTHIHSLIRDRKLAFANLVRAFLRFNVSSISSVEVMESEDMEVYLYINENTYKFDVSDYTGPSERYVFFNPSSGRLVIQGNGVLKVYKLDVDLLDA